MISSSSLFSPPLQPILQSISLTIPLVYIVSGTFSVVIFVLAHIPQKLEQLDHFTLLRNPISANMSEKGSKAGKEGESWLKWLLTWSLLSETYRIAP